MSDREKLLKEAKRLELLKEAKALELSRSGDDDSDFSLKGLARGAVQTLPAVGGVLGGLVGTPLGPAGLLGGGALGAGAGKALENVIESQLFGDKKTYQQILEDPIYEGVSDLAGGAIVGGIARPLGGLKNIFTKYAIEPAEKFATKLQDIRGPRAERILESAKTFDVTPTKGMLSDSPQIRGFESSLSQQPSSVGVDLRQRIDDIFGAVGGKVKDLAAADATTPIQAGISARKQIGKELTGKTKSAVDFYNSIESTRDAIPINEIAKFRVSANISKLPASKIAGSPEKAFLGNMSESLKNLTNLTDLRDLRTYAGNVARDKAASPNMRESAGEVVDRLNRLERSSILRAAQETGAKNSEAIGRELIADIKKANKTYAIASKEVKEIADGMGVGKVRNYQEFIRKLEAMPDEKVVDKLFQENNIKQLQKLKSSFPKTYELTRKAKISEMFKDAVTKDGVNEGELNVKKLLSSVEKLSDESRDIIFGKDASKILKDARTVLASFPEKMGPSGTPQGQRFQNFDLTNPTTWVQEFSDQMKRFALENPKLTKGLAKSGADRKYMKSTPLKKGLKEKGFLRQKAGATGIMESVDQDE